MIITTTIRLWLNAMIGIIELLPQLPSLPNELTTIANRLIDFIFTYGSLILFFLPPINILSILVELSIALELFSIGYWIVMWLMNKIPFFNIH